MTTLARTILALLLACVAVPAEAQRAPKPPRAYIAPSDATVLTVAEESQTMARNITIYVINRSSVPIIVYTASLRDCENIKQSCTPVRLNLRVRPDGRMPILRASPKNEMEGMRYSYSFGWRADSAAIRALETLAAAGSSEAQARLDANAERPTATPTEIAAPRGLDRRDLWLDSAMVLSLGERLASVRAEPDSMTIREGRAFLLRQVRLMAYDDKGDPLGQLGIRFRWSYPPGAVLLTRADTIYGALPGRSEISFRIETGGRILETKLPVIVLPDSGGRQR